MSSSNRLRKRQSRLAFTPLPSSSPAAKGYHKQIQARAAAVSLEGSTPAKRRKVRDNDLDNGLGTAQMDGVNDSIPTPAASMTQDTRAKVDDISESDSEPIGLTKRRPSTQDKVTSTRTSRQRRLDFSDRRDPDTFSSPVKLSSPSNIQSSGRTSMFSTQRKRTVVAMSSDESDDLPSPGKLLATKKGRRANKTSAIHDTSERRTRSTRQPTTVESESEGDNIIVSNEPPRSIEQENEDDDMPTTIGKQRRKRTRRASPDSFISSSPPIIIDSDDDLEVIEKPKNRRRRDEMEEEEEELVTPSRRKLKRVKQTNRREKEDLAEDLDFLEPSSDIENSARKARSTQTAKKNVKQIALEKLKRRRSGQPAKPEQEEDEQKEDEADVDEPDAGDDDAGGNAMNSSQVFKENDYDQDFIEEDEDNPLGVPDVPIGFTRYASMKSKELFRYAVDWMIQKKINPAFAIDDELYDLTFRKLDDEVKGLAASKFTSSVWKPEFTIALKSRPDIAYEEIERKSAEHYMRDSCDACNRTNHPATWQIQFQGVPYHQDTLEEVAQNEDEDDESSSNNEDDSEVNNDLPSVNAHEQEVSPSSTIYYVGRFCWANAKQAHALEHWRYHLNEWVVNWIVAQGYNTPERIVERDRWSVKKRQKYGNKITDRMEQEGVIKTLWRDFHGNIDEARNSKQGRY